MDSLIEKFGLKIEGAREQVKELKAHSDFVLGEYTLGQVLTGMKGIQGLICETSSLDPIDGIRFRGYSIPELKELLPKVEGGVEPLPEGIFYLMLMDELPTKDDVAQLSKIWASNGALADHVKQTLDSLPVDTHPMTQFSIGVMAMQNDSKFAKAYRDGIGKQDYWKSTFEDVMLLIAKLPTLAAYIYRRTYHNGDHIAPNPDLDWAGNFAHMLGFEGEDFRSLMRLYLTIHADHEGGNVSAHTTHLVGSALSDAYLSFAAAMNGLAGPLHGLANQEVIRWIFAMREDIGTNDPSKEQIEAYVKSTLAAGRVVPGYGHAVLRKTDPRYTAQREFALEHMPNDELFKIVNNLYEVVPDILAATGKVKNPWPNVDAHSGALLVHYGLDQYDFYTVMFGVSRALGVLASLVWDRVMMLPLERPKSNTSKAILEKLSSVSA